MKISGSGTLVNTTVHLHRLDGGHGPAVIALHGLFGAGMNLAALAKALEPKWRVLRPDLRNHGRSPRAATMSYAELAADIVALMDNEGLDRAALLGHSMGGKVAMEVALRYPGRVAALVVADIAPVAYPVGRHHEIFSAFAAVDEAQVRSRSEAGRLMAPFIPDDDKRAFLLTNLVRDGDGYRWRLAWHELEASQPALAAAQPDGPAFDRPVLFVMGGESDYFDQGDRDAVLSRFPAAEVRVIDGAGHWVHVDRPAAFNRLVSRYFEENYPPA